jgi:hypothetical protein
MGAALVDPRARGFNYGPGWGTAPKPAIYHTADAIAFVLRNQAGQISKQAWSLDMALRNVRLASTDQEKVRAVVALELEVAKYLPCASDF